MLTFAQFVTTETGFITEEDVNSYGFLRPDGKPIRKTGKDRGKWNHYLIAKKHGFEGPHDAVKKGGWVRFDQYHHWQGLPPDVDHYAGYTFRNDPKSKHAVADHLRKSGKFDKIVFDVHHGAKKLKSHEFRSNGEALRHLGESFLLEGPEYYTNFGWIKPDGSYHDGAKFPKAKTHQDILPKEMKGKGSQDYHKAFSAGWVRHGQMKYDKSHVFHAGKINRSNVNTIDNFMMSQKHHDMGGDKYRLMADEPTYKEINGQSREHFIHALHN